MNIIDLVQGSDAWLEYRKNKITASDIATIMGLNPFKSEYRLFQEQMGAIEPPLENERMKRGRKLEPIARKLVNESLGSNYVPICAEHSLHNFLFCSVDGWDISRPISLLEIKCPSLENHLLDNKVPDYYYPQLQCQMYVFDVRSCYYVSYCPDHSTPLAIVEVHRDDSFCEKMVNAARVFYERRLNFDPPLPCGKDREAIYIKDEELIALSLKRLSLNQSITTLKNEMDSIDEKLKNLCIDQDIVIGNLRISKSIRRGSIDYESIEEIKFMDLEKYRKPSKEILSIREVKY